VAAQSSFPEDWCKTATTDEIRRRIKEIKEHKDNPNEVAREYVLEVLARELVRRKNPMTDYIAPATPADWLCASCGRPRGEHSCLGFTRLKIKFAAMLRVQNERRYIAQVLESIRPLCDRIYVMDDHSTDGTPLIVNQFKIGWVGEHEYETFLLPSPFIGLNEARDKNWLYDQILKDCEPEWILCIDGDEVLEADGPQLIREVVRRSSPFPIANSYRLKIEFFWNDEQHVRSDRIYSDFWRPSLFRPFIPDPLKPDNLKVAEEFRFKSTPFGRHVNSDQPNLHCSSVPQRRIHGAKCIPVRLKHYGYLDRAERVRKLDSYTSIDWKNEAEDWYRHICQGDDPQLSEMPKVQELAQRGEMTPSDLEWLLNNPASATLLHAGPLKLTEWKETEPWRMSEWAKAI